MSLQEVILVRKWCVFVAFVLFSGVYVCGSYSSSSGLTVTLLKEPQTGDYILEAGALVLADQGVEFLFCLFFSRLLF
jgi:DNA replicative helicase MCM subunit Mcm2 (Cdc46/Mcm family)